MKWKVCGMRQNENIQAIKALEPDYMGFIFWAPSPRHVEGSTPVLPRNIKKTGVFVDASMDYIQDCVNTHQLQAVQLHGKESPEYCNLVKAFRVEVIKAFSVNDDFKFEQLTAYEKACDFFLFDTKGELPGGNGTSFNWKILAHYTHQKPFFLSGGIGPDDVSEVNKIRKEALPLYAIDVNSKFERSPGDKNVDLLAKFKKELYEL